MGRIEPHLFGGGSFRKLIGGFGEGKVSISDLQVAELLGYRNGVRQVRQQIERNITHFDDNHIIDMKNIVVAESDNNKEVLKSLGYSAMAIGKSKNIYLFSKAGFILFLKFAEGDRSVEIYKNFIEDYFKTKAINDSMKKSIGEQIKILKEEKAMLFGKAIMSSNDYDKVDLMSKSENITNQILKLELSMNSEEVKKELITKLKPQLQVGEMLEKAKSNLDMNIFAKTLDIKGMGRNNLFKWLREKGYLNKSNIPYQKYEDYFMAIPVVSQNGYSNSKTLIKPKGIKFIVDKLVDDGVAISKTIEQIIDELEIV